MPCLTNIGTLVTCPPEGGQGDLGAVRGAAMVWEGDTITWLGPRADLPREADQREGASGNGPSYDCGGRLVIPGLVDCHTHLAFGGWRADEFAARSAGTGYPEIAARGGGIASTVRATRAMSRQELADRAGGFLQGMVRLGITAVECKSGYGLSVEHELRTLRAYRDLSGSGAPRLVPTCLAGHMVPAEYAGDRQGYIRLVTEEILPAVAREGLASFCDAFLEPGPGLDAAETTAVLEAGHRHGMVAKLHADQLTDGGGARLAASLGAISADHLECVSDEGIEAMAEAGTIAVVLPIAGVYLNCPPPPVRRMVEAGVQVAVATDFNPGSAPSYHLPLALTLACVKMGMSPAEAVRGATTVAARACGLEDVSGSLAPGRPADFAVIDAPDVDSWLYHFKEGTCAATVIGGVTAAGQLPGSQ